MVKNIKIWKTLFVLMLFLCSIFMMSGVTYAEQVIFYPRTHTIHNYQKHDKSPLILDGSKNVAHENIDEVWYYTIPNYKAEAVTVSFILYGPVSIYGDSTYVKNLYVSFADTIPAQTTRMYFYTVYTADKSYEASEIHSIDIVLNANGTIASTGNFRSLVAVGMGDDGKTDSNGRHEEDVKYYLKKEEVEPGGAHFYGYPDESNNPHYIQFLYPDASRQIQMHTFVQSGPRPIGTAVSDRSCLVSELSWFNGNVSPYKDIPFVTIYDSVSNKSYYYSNLPIGASGRSDMSREPLGCIVMDYEKQYAPADTTAPDVSIWAEPSVTNQPNTTVYLKAWDSSGIKNVQIWEYLLNFNDNPLLRYVQADYVGPTEDGWSLYKAVLPFSNGDSWYRFWGVVYDNYDNLGRNYTEALYDATTPGISVSNIAYPQSATINMSDNLSGVKYYAITDANANWPSSWHEITPINSTSVTVSNLVPGTYYAWDEDAAGNWNRTMFTVDKGQNPISVSARDLTYNAQNQSLVSTSNVQGTVYYSLTTQLTSSNFTSGSTTIPTGINAKTYTVYWYVTGNSGYYGKSGYTYVTIKPYDLSKTGNVTFGNYAKTVTYDTEAYTPEPTIGVTIPENNGAYNLTKNVHFTYKYRNNTNAGTATIIIEAKSSNYTKSAEDTFTINKYNLSNATLAAIPDEEYNMREHKPNPNLTISTHTGKTVRLVLNSHYTCSYSNNVNAGTASVTISSTGSNITGSRSTTFKINPYNLNKATIADISAYTYNMKAQRPTPQVTVPISPAGVNPPTALTSGTDFTFSYGDDTNATQKSNNTWVKITAKSSNYTGSKTKNYTINPYSLTNATIASISNYTYDGTAKQPKPAVTVPLSPAGSNPPSTLREGTDFSYVYSNNVNAGTATVKIKAIPNSNYKDEASKNFTINKYDITPTNNATVAAITDVFTYDTLAFTPKPAVTVPFRTAKLQENSEIKYTYQNNINASTSSSKAKVIITATNVNFTGSRTVEFTINPYNLRNATISNIPDQTYTMRQLAPEITVTAYMTRNVVKTLTVGTEILSSYGENINVGNNGGINAGSVRIYPNTVSPHNTNYTSDQTKYFKIIPYDLANATIADVTDKFVYDTKEFKPTPKVTVPLSPSGKNPPTELMAGRNFEYVYINNVHAGTATVSIRSCDTNYKGTNSKNFTIEKFDLSTVSVADIGDLIYKMEQHRPTPTVTAHMTRNVVKTLIPGTEITYVYGENTNVGNNGGTNAGWVRIEPKSTDYKNSKTIYFNIRPYNLENATIGQIDRCIYDTLAFTPTPIVTVPLPPDKGPTALTKNVHYTYSYQNNIHAGTAKVTITAAHTNYTGSKSKNFTIEPYDLAGATIDNIPDEEYNTLQHTPQITVTSNMTRNVRIPLRPGVEITVTYGPNVNVGNDKTKAGTVTISPGPDAPNKTDYTNSQLKYFTIEPYSLTNALIDEIPDRVYNEHQHTPEPRARVPIPTEENPTTIVAPTNFVFEYGANVNAGIDAGSVTIKSTPNDTNYKDYQTVYFTIRKRPLVIPTAVDKEYYYNGLEQTFAVNHFNTIAGSMVVQNGLLSIKNNKQINAGLYTVTISIKDKNNNMWEGVPNSKIWSDEATADKLYTWRIHKINQELALNPDTPITVVRWNSTDVNYEDWGEGTVKVTSANPGIATIVYTNNSKTYYGELNLLERSRGKATITGVTPGETIAKYDMEETTNYFKLQREVPVIVLEAYYSITHGEKTIYYNKLEDAIAAAVNGDTIKVIKDVTETTSNVIDKNITLDLMNNKITSSGSITINNGINVSIIGKTENGKSGGIENTSGTAIINNGTLTLDKSAGEGIICAPVIKGTNLSINSTNGTFNFYDGKLIGSNNLPYSGTAEYKPKTYIYTYKENGLYISILKPDTTPPIITGEKPDKTLINVGTTVKMNVNVTEPESGIRTEEFTKDDLRFFVYNANGETEVTNLLSYVDLTFGFDYNGIYRYLLEFKGVPGNGKLKIKVDKDKVYNLALLGNPEAIITENDITVDNTSATLSAEIRLVTPSGGISTDGNYQAEITRVSDENYLRDYEWEMKGPEDDDWKKVKVFKLGDSSSNLIGTVTIEGKYQIRVKVTDTVGNKAYSNVVEFEFRNRLDYNAKPSISFEKEIVSNTEVVIHAIVKSTTKLVSAKVNGNDYSASEIQAGETVEGTWQIRTELNYTANINTLFKFEVTDSQNNTTVATYAVTDISRKEASITYKIVDATAYENAKIEFHSQEDVLFTGMPEGFEIAKDSSTYGRDFKVDITSEMQAINHDFNFVNDIGTETVVHVEGNVETSYRNIRNVSGVISELNSVKELKNVYGEKGITYERAKNLVLRMKNAKAVFEGTIKSYYGIDVTEINMRVSNNDDISVANILGGASVVQIKDASNQIVNLEKGKVEIITSAERGQLYSSNSNKTGIYFKEEYLVNGEGTSGNSFHVTILNK